MTSRNLPTSAKHFLEYCFFPILPFPSIFEQFRTEQQKQNKVDIRLNLKINKKKRLKMKHN